MAWTAQNAAGDEVEVDIEPGSAPRAVPVPADLAAELDRHPDLQGGSR